MPNTAVGTLNDTEILEAIQKGSLIVENAIPQNVKQACYELRAGNVYFDLSDGGERHNIHDGGTILFKPHQTIVIISKEKFDLPADIMARFLTRGALFSVGFTPINTYADPGFSGNMGIVMTNASNNYLKICSGDVIAKVEFTRLEKPIVRPYHGQHGFATGIWPIRTDYIIKRSEITKYFSNHNDIEEIKSICGESVANIIQRVLVTERRFVFATIILILVNLIVIGISIGTAWLSPIMNVILGIITNLVYAIISMIIGNYKHRKK